MYDDSFVCIEVIRQSKSFFEERKRLHKHNKNRVRRTRWQHYRNNNVRYNGIYIIDDNFYLHTYINNPSEARCRTQQHNTHMRLNKKKYKSN